MRSSIFFAFIALSVSVQALPLARRSESADLTTLSSSNSTLATISAASTALPVSLTSLPSLNATLAFGNGSAGVTATDASATATLATAYTTYSFASPTDTASNSSSTGYASAASNFTYSTAEPIATAVSFDIPDVPPACLALTSGGVLPQTTTLPTSSDASFIPLTTLSPDPSGSLSTSPIASTTASNATITPTATANSTVSVLPTDVASNTTLFRRIAQDDLPAVAQSWQDLCLVSNGNIFTNEPCVKLAGVNGINALLADADPCAQQDNADAMIDFAHSPGVTNTDALIANAVAYAGHPRNALNINGVVPSTPFCERAPRNPELADVVRPQLEGVNPGIYGSVSLGLFAFGADGTCPFGQTADVSTCGCS